MDQTAVLPFDRQPDGTVVKRIDLDQGPFRKVVQTYRQLAASQQGPAYGMLYRPVADDPFEALELDQADRRVQALTGPADVVLATLDARTLDGDQFDAWLQVFANARRVFAELAESDPDMSEAHVISEILYRTLVGALPGI